MKLIGIQTKEVCGLFEISSKDLDLLLTALDNCVVHTDKNDPKTSKASAYLTDVFTKQLIAFEKALEEEYGIRPDAK